MSVQPTLNALLNATSALLILLGYFFIRQRKTEAHKYSMVAALVTSTIFLASYLIYHFQHGSTRFTGTGIIRTVYFTILITHTVLAAGVVPMILTAVYRAWKGQWERHKAIARWTLPIWLYVSVTGVIVYLMLYHL